MYTPPRQRTRIVPHRAITVEIDDDNGLPLGYGVIPNVSEDGACLWTDRQLDPGRRLVMRVSFAHPEEVHEVAALIVWADDGADPSEAPVRRHGLRWHDPSSACVLRLRQLAREAFGERRTGSRPALKVVPGG